MGLTLTSRILSLGLLSLTLSAVANGQEVIDDPQYGRVLYHYFQGDYHQALTQMAIAEVRGGIKHQGLAPELLKGGMSLGYGLEQQASEIFRRLLDDSVPVDIQAQAWLHLARVYYRKNEVSTALQILNQIQPQQVQLLGSAAGQQFYYLKAQLQLAIGQIEPAQHTLAELKPDSIYFDYLSYNHALQLQHQGKVQLAIDSLNQLRDKAPSGVIGSWLDEWFGWQAVKALPIEQAALNDRINLSLAYFYQQQQRPTQAIEAFSRIRFDSLDTHAALLGYGWAAAQDQQYQLALTLWNKLLALPDSSSEQQEAWLAVAYAYEQLSAPQQAMNALQQAISQFELQLQQLNVEQRNIQQGDYFEPFVRLWQPEFDGLLKAAEERRIAPSLQAIFSSERFNQQIKTLAELRTTGQRLSRWQAQIKNYQLMIDEREQVTGQRARDLSQNKLLDKLAELLVRRNALAARISEIEQGQNSAALLDSKQLAQQQRLERAMQRYQRLSAKKTLPSSYQERLKRLQGVLSWQADNHYAQNLWSAKKALAELDSSIEQSVEQQHSLSRSMNQTPLFNQQRERISTLGQHISQLQVKQRTLQQLQLDQITHTARLALQQESDKIRQLLLQAQVAVVRLQDEAWRKNNAIEHLNPDNTDARGKDES
ncbi:tetratricopeptide repeat protein [Neptunicella sp. SCSIO 80796]|uniref:tetratricopeptide repeat protein n=1 Tax=Neptunicella plasticusilytica TaxID=3117012 RepID=UPI003A4DD5F1